MKLWELQKLLRWMPCDAKVEIVLSDGRHEEARSVKLSPDGKTISISQEATEE